MRTRIPLRLPKEEDFLPLDLKSTWQGMEQCMEMGLTKAIGVSNFSSKKIEDLLSHANIPPAVNQVMSYLIQVCTCKSMGKLNKLFK